MTSEEEAGHCADSAFPYLYYRRQHADCQARFTAYRRALPVGRKPLPFGRGVTEGDGEGKPVTAGLLCSDKQKSLSERYYRCVCISPPASLPSQALRASSPKVGATGVPVRPTPDEQSLIFRKQECPAVKTNSSLTKCAYPEPSTRPVPQRAREPDAFFAFCCIPTLLCFISYIAFQRHFMAISMHFPCFLVLQKCTFPHF